jgi:hypothetical protein
MKDPDRFESAHMRHENVHDHQIEFSAFEGAEPCLAAIGDRDPKVVSLEIDLDCHAHHRIVVDDENMRHAIPLRLDVLRHSLGSF